LFVKEGADVFQFFALITVPIADLIH
jgi:hypothetical protein